MSKLALLSPKPVVTFAIVLLVAAILPTIVFATVAPPGAPETLVIATPRGESRLVVRPD